MLSFIELDKKIKEQATRLYTEFGVASLAIFGSVARGQEKPESDVDFLVRFSGEPTFERYASLKLFLEDLLQCPIDLVTEDAIRPRMRASIEEDIRRVA